MDNSIEVIGIDHGWSHMKTANEIFVSGIKELTKGATFYDDTLEYGGKFYKVGGDRMEVKDGKTENENYYLLTLAAIAKELENRGKRQADVILSVGLPLTRFADEKDDFVSSQSESSVTRRCGLYLGQ